MVSDLERELDTDDARQANAHAQGYSRVSASPRKFRRIYRES
jgi:hypothetical protein